MKFKAMVNDTDFEGNKIEGFEVVGYLTCDDNEDFQIRQEGEKCLWYIDPSTLEIVKEKRKPDSNGVLPLTDEEKQEFSNKFLKHTNFIYFFMVIDSKIHMRFLNGIYDNVRDDYKAILWLAERFNLGDE